MEPHLVLAGPCETVWAHEGEARRTLPFPEEDQFTGHICPSIARFHGPSLAG